MELGPSGFPFENFIGHIFRHDGYTTDVGVVMQGNCVTHEVDVFACKDDKCYIIECKYHNSQGKPNDVKIPLYIHSRYNDVKRQLEQDKSNSFTNYQGWIFTNTRFTLDAMAYAKCAGLQLVSWDYPENKSLKYRINKSRLFPITTLTSLTKREKQDFLKQGVVLCKEIYEKPELLHKNGFSKMRIKKIQDDITDLCENPFEET
jgi:Holliday junction resolvase